VTEEILAHWGLSRPKPNPPPPKKKLIRINNVFIIILHVVKIFPKREFYKYFIQGRELDCQLYFFVYNYSNKNPSVMLLNVKPHNDCLMQPKQVDFWITIIGCVVWTD